MADTNENTNVDAPIVDNSGPANIAPATEFDPSGAPLQSVPDVDAKHPAVDSDPRAGTTVNQNRIDFNDPTIPGDEAVVANLKAQGSKLVADEKAKK